MGGLKNGGRSLNFTVSTYHKYVMDLTWPEFSKVPPLFNL